MIIEGNRVSHYPGALPRAQGSLGRNISILAHGYAGSARAARACNGNPPARGAYPETGDVLRWEGRDQPPRLCSQEDKAQWEWEAGPRQP